MKAMKDNPNITYRRIPIWVTEDLSCETMENRQSKTTFSTDERKELSTINSISRKISIRTESKIKMFLDERNLKEFDTRKHILKEWQENTSNKNFLLEKHLFFN